MSGEPRKDMTRRQFLKVVGVVSAGLGVLTVIKPKENDNPVSSTPTVKPTTSSSENDNRRNEPREERLSQDVFLLIDGESNSPIGYRIKDQRFELDVGVMEAARKKARETGETEIAIFQRIPNPEVFGLADRSVVERPEGIVEERELKEKYGVEIVGSPGLYPRLSIRQGAFLKGSLLERNGDFAGKFTCNPESVEDYVQPRLIIGLLDSGSVVDTALTGDCYEKIRRILRINNENLDERIWNYRKKKLEMCNSDLARAREKDLDSGVLALKEQIEWLKSLTDDELRLEAGYDLGGGSVGIIFPEQVEAETGLMYRIVLVSVGNGHSRRLVVTVNDRGKFEGKISENMVENLAPTGGCGDFDPDQEFSSQRNLGGVGTLRHELSHYKQGIVDGGDHKRNEAEMDEEVIRGYRKAAELLRGGDDSGYYFVWQLPNGRYIRG